MRRCPWCNGYPRRKWTRLHSEPNIGQRLSPISSMTTLYKPLPCLSSKFFNLIFLPSVRSFSHMLIISFAPSTILLSSCKSCPLSFIQNNFYIPYLSLLSDSCESIIIISSTAISIILYMSLSFVSSDLVNFPVFTTIIQWYHIITYFML